MGACVPVLWWTDTPRHASFSVWSPSSILWRAQVVKLLMGHFVSHHVNSVSSGSSCPQRCILKHLNLHMILGCHSVIAEDSCLLACYVMWTHKYMLIYRSPWHNVLKDVDVHCRGIFGPICEGGRWWKEVQ